MSLQVYELQKPTNIRISGTFQVVKAEKRRIIAGYASVEVIDSEQEKIPVPALKEAFKGFFNAKDFRNINLIHSNLTIGKLIDSYTDDEGKLWKSHVDDIGLFAVCEIREDISAADDAWKLINASDPNERMNSFSIGGRAIQWHYEYSPIKHKVITKLELYEISICKRGMNAPSRFVVVKAEQVNNMDPSNLVSLFAPSSKMSVVSMLIKNGDREYIISSEAREGNATGELSESAVTTLEERVEIESGNRKDKTTLDKDKEGKADPAKETAKDETSNPAGKDGVDSTKGASPELVALTARLDKIDEGLKALMAAFSAKPGEKKSDAEKTEAKPKEEEKDETKGKDDKEKAKKEPSLEELKASMIEDVTKAAKDEILKLFPAAKTTVVPKTGAPGENRAWKMPTQAEFSKMTPEEVQALEEKRKAAILGVDLDDMIAKIGEGEE